MIFVSSHIFENSKDKSYENKAYTRWRIQSFPQLWHRLHWRWKAQNLIVVTSVNGNRKTTIFRYIIADTDASQKPNCAITIQDDKGLNTFLLPLQSKNERYKEAFSKIRFYQTGDNSSVKQLQKDVNKLVWGWKN